MPTKTWVVGEEVLAADFNTYVQKQVVPTFSTGVARDAAIPSPVVGQCCYVDEIKEVQVFTDRTTPSSWRKPWSMPWGLQQVGVAGDIMVVTTPQWGMQCTVPLARRNYRLQYQHTWQAQAICTAQVRFQQGVVIGTINHYSNNAGFQLRWSVHEEFSWTGSAGDNVAGFIVNTDVSGGPTQWGRWQLYDVGPA